MRYGTWNVRSLYRSSSLKTAPKELARYKLDVLGVQEVKFFSMEKETKIIYSE